jgi:NAD(P)-dependent dehydrogenase (short-subunit alcohol dehydrogenase family)
MVIVITGAATGIGAGLAARFTADGDVVAGIDLPARVGEIEADVALGADVTVPDEVVGAVGAVVDKLGRVDAFIANAGLGVRASIEDAPWDDIRRVVDVNLFGVLHCFRAVLPTMRAQGSGRLVAVVSRNAELCPRDLVGYNASKAGVVAAVRTLARELDGTDILVNNLIPGPTRTEMNPTGTLPTDASYPTARMLVSLPAGGPSGRTFFEERDYPFWSRFS